MKTPWARKATTSIEASKGPGPGLDFQEWLSYFTFSGLDYPILNQTLAGVPQPWVPPVFSGLSELAFKLNGVIFACLLTRMQLFSEARFKFRPKRSINSGDLFGAASLGLLEEPWPRGNTSQLLTRIMLDQDLAGNAYVWKETASLLRILRPDWMTIVLGTQRPDGEVGDADTEILGYIYRPLTGQQKVFLPEEIAHFAPIPDPMLPFRGVSWLLPVIEEMRADNAMTTHKLKFFENGASPNMVVTLNSITDKEEFDQWIEAFEHNHKGYLNAYKTLYLAGGASAQVVGIDLKQADFSVVQSHGESRIAIAARIPPILVGLSEGLDKGSYAAYPQAKRHFADGTMRPLWRYTCAILGNLIDVPAGAELWYEDRDIPWLAEDQKDAAAIMQANAATIASLVMAGYDPETVVEAVQSGDLSQLEHSGLYSVQLQPPGTQFTPTPSQNGNDSTPAPAAK